MKPQKKVFRAPPRQALRKATPRTCVLHGSARSTEPQQELYRFLAPTSGLLRNGTVVASGDGELLLELVRQGVRTVRDVSLTAGENNLNLSLRITRGELVRIQSQSAFDLLDFSFLLVEELDPDA